jgi:hypothetical protein
MGWESNLELEKITIFSAIRILHIRHLLANFGFLHYLIFLIFFCTRPGKYH